VGLCVMAEVGLCTWVFMEGCVGVDGNFEKIGARGTEAFRLFSPACNVCSPL
jgi:hypothetical protein